MSESIRALYEVIEDRKKSPQEGSYTAYLFEQGLDKILKKCGEETAEVLIAAKNGDKVQTKEEICDLTYHLLVLMAEQGISVDEIATILEQRRQKISNLKPKHESDPNS